MCECSSVRAYPMFQNVDSDKREGPCSLNLLIATHAQLTLLLSPGESGGLSFGPALMALVLLLSNFLVSVDRRLCTGAVKKE